MFDNETNDYALSDCAWWDEPVGKRPYWAAKDCAGRVGDTERGVLCEEHYNAIPKRKSRPNSNYILQLMRDDDIAYDPWGTAMAWAFGCAETLDVLGADVPDELGYQPSPYVNVEDADTYQPESYPDSEVWSYLQAGGEAAVADVQFAARCLHRYIDWCKAAGKDY